MKRSRNTTEEAKLEKRRKRNREAAKKCREKKNQQIETLEKEKVIFEIEKSFSTDLTSRRVRKLDYFPLLIFSKPMNFLKKFAVL